MYNNYNAGVKDDSMDYSLTVEHVIVIIMINDYNYNHYYYNYIIIIIMGYRLPSTVKNFSSGALTELDTAANTDSVLLMSANYIRHSKYVLIAISCTLPPSVPLLYAHAWSRSKSLVPRLHA